MIRILSAIFTLMLFCSLGQSAQACACCTDIGQRFEGTGDLDGYAREELARVEFAASARLFADPGFPDTVEGISTPSDQGYRIKVSQTGRQMVFGFADASGVTGSVTFPLPKRFTRFEVDPRAPGETDGGTGPTLYKEWRFQGIAKLGGNLAAHGVWANARLILHGRGNGCTSAVDFGNWTLAVLGKGINFRFLGATRP